MLTTCLECNTTFGIHAAQLGARRGMVRCGNCAAVFNAYDTLRDDDNSVPIPTPAPASAPAVPPAFEVPAETAPDAGDWERQAGELDAAVRESRSDETFATHFSVAPQDEAEAGEAVTDWPDAAESADRQDTPRREAPGQRAPDAVDWDELDENDVDQNELDQDEVDPDYIDRDEVDRDAMESSDDILFSELPAGPPPARTLLYAGLLLVGLSLASLFTLYAFRSEIVQQQPQWRPWMERACATLGCRIPLVRDLTDLRLAWSQLETDPDDPLRASLRFVLINLAGHELAWPQVTLRLTAADQTTIARKTFDPAQYLPAEFGYRAEPDDGIERGLPPRSEHEFRVDFTLDNGDAVSFEVDLGYP